jgi:acyl-CoA thioester hydrolase
MSFSYPLEVRFRDLDVLGHVNNAVMATYLEQARVSWWWKYLAGRPFESEGCLIARIEIDYKKPVLLEDKIHIELWCSKIGRCSFELSYRVLRTTDKTLMAEGKSVQVMYDFSKKKPMAITEKTQAWLKTQTELK